MSAERTAPPKAVLDLIERFERNREAYKSPQYNETQLRREFLDPFFKALGWDIDNEQGYAEPYKDVVHEYSMRIGERTKAPDYCFRIGGAEKFLVEAKRPSIDIKNDIEPAFQLRRYAWTKKLPLSVLSDFEEFAVYDCRVKPDQKDKAGFARILYIPFTEYVERWDEIASVFSRDAVLKGGFDKYAESNKLKRGTADVDEEFLKTIETWRADLARNLALRNAKLSQRELNFAVQRIIDRIIFLRICEGRGIESYGRLQALANGDRIYPRLCQLFEEADARYNSGLFHFKPEKGRHETPDELTLGLSIDDKLLREIFRSLYYPESPYVFSALPADILGQVYEQFLGKVIRLTENHHAIVEKKPEVKKAGGVYYTPTYIVNYIVENTVGKLLEGKNPKQAAKLKILDPACGSGSFLLGAYEHLLKWHLDYYTKNDPKKWAKGARPTLVQIVHSDDTRTSVQGWLGDPKPKIENWRLTISERKRILLDNIFGVDIDSQAVETTKLSLLLKVLEGETQQSLQPVLSIFHERALPDLGDNIKCGNSLIGSDFYQQQQLALLTEDERFRINVFDWDGKDGFPEIMDNGRFDAVIGNPPYVLLQDEFRDDPQLEYFRKKFVGAAFKIDTYHLFIEQGIALSKSIGRVSMITPANLLTNNHLDKLRRIILQRSAIDHILVADGGVFRGISVDNSIFVVEPGQPTTKNFPIIHARPEREALIVVSSVMVSPDRALTDEHVLFTGRADTSFPNTWKRLAARCWQLNEIADVNFGKQLRDRKKFQDDVIEVARLKDVPATHSPCFTGRDVNRYCLTWGRLACLKDQRARSGGCWDESKHHAKNKLITRQIGRFPDFALDRDGWDCLNTVFMINVRQHSVDFRYLLGVLNSNLMHALWLDRFYDQRRTFPKIKGSYLKQLPIWRLDPGDLGQKRSADQIINLVDQILDLHKALSSAKTPQEKTSLERQISATDTQIDKLVYELYELSPQEIAIVEGKSTTVAQSPVAENLPPERKPDSEKELSYAEPPPAPTHPNLTPEQAAGDAAHYYSAKEESPPYGEKGLLSVPDNPKSEK